MKESNHRINVVICRTVKEVDNICDTQNELSANTKSHVSLCAKKKLFKKDIECFDIELFFAQNFLIKNVHDS